jgi:drug/metabolite transporter (DMT)-like permease
VEDAVVTDLLRHAQGLMAMDWPTIIVVCVLCGLASYFLKEYLANPPMIIFVYPVLVGLSLLAQYTFTVAELYVPKKLDQWLMWTILATICGTIAGTALVAGLVSLREGFSRRKA